MKVQLSRELLDKHNETENAENIAHMRTYPELNVKFSNQGHHSHQYSSAPLHNMNEYPLPPYQPEQGYIPGHRHHGNGQSFSPGSFELTNVPRTTKVPQTILLFLIIRVANLENVTVCLRDTSRQSRQ